MSISEIMSSSNPDESIKLYSNSLIRISQGRRVGHDFVPLNKNSTPADIANIIPSIDAVSGIIKQVECATGDLDKLKLINKSTVSVLRESLDIFKKNCEKDRLIEYFDECWRLFSAVNELIAIWNQLAFSFEQAVYMCEMENPSAIDYYNLHSSLILLIEINKFFQKSYDSFRAGEEIEKLTGIALKHKISFSKLGKEFSLERNDLDANEKAKLKRIIEIINTDVSVFKNFNNVDSILRELLEIEIDSPKLKNAVSQAILLLRLSFANIKYNELEVDLKIRTKESGCCMLTFLSGGLDFVREAFVKTHHEDKRLVKLNCFYYEKNHHEKIKNFYTSAYHKLKDSHYSIDPNLPTPKFFRMSLVKYSNHKFLEIIEREGIDHLKNEIIKKRKEEISSVLIESQSSERPSQKKRSKKEISHQRQIQEKTDVPVAPLSATVKDTEDTDLSVKVESQSSEKPSQKKRNKKEISSHLQIQGKADIQLAPVSADTVNTKTQPFYCYKLRNESKTPPFFKWMDRSLDNSQRQIIGKRFSVFIENLRGGDKRNIQGSNNEIMEWKIHNFGGIRIYYTDIKKLDPNAEGYLILDQGAKQIQSRQEVNGSIEHAKANLKMLQTNKWEKVLVRQEDLRFISN